GFGGIAGHAAIGQSRYELGYMARPWTVQDMSAVTAACLMVDAKVFKEVEGLDETFKVAFNDVDFCMKVRDKGYLIVYNPAVELYHYESKSRGYEDNPEKVARFNSEIKRFRDKWSKELEDGDPFYNKNLSLDKADYSLRGENEKLA
ncbi:MAG: glycosyltransferase family 2 protein, partial [Lachnospiraceae bacterium]|nr:glycosyltransferase family 2 protein [Lachnospiraceae bacterium]